MLSERVVRVKIWTLEGRIVYSDEPRLVGMTYKPKEDHAEAVATGEIGAEIASTTGPENEFERDFGQLLEVYMPLRAPDGTPLVYEQYETYDSIVGDSRQLMWRLALPLLGCVALLWLVQLPLAWRLASRVRAAQEQHASLAEAAVTASTRERERIAVELHDGVVQDLAGLTYELSALGSRTTEPEAKAALVRSADIARTAMQQVRSSLVDLHPGTIDALGLEAAIEQLAEPLRRRGMDVGVQIDSTTLPIGAQALFYRVARELLRNVDEHANAARADVTLMTDASGATLVVSDNGTGIDNEALSRRRADGHVGLDLHRAVVAHQGGTMDIDSTAGSGTSVSVRLPL